MLASDMTSPYLASISNRLTMWGVSARRALLHNGVLDVVGGSIDDGRAHATARHAAGVDHGIDAPLDEVRRQSRAVGDRKSVVEGKNVDVGGCWCIKKRIGYRC